MLTLITGRVLGVSAKGSEATEKIVVGTNAEYSPFEYRDSNGELIGFDIELMEAIAEEEGIELEWNDFPFDSLIGSMESGDIQLIAAAIAPTEERAQSVDFLMCITRVHRVSLQMMDRKLMISQN
ncbi:MAG: transporter substrate-binding domain-containing protein [Anaerocolumna sp.]